MQDPWSSASGIVSITRSFRAHTFGTICDSNVGGSLQRRIRFAYSQSHQIHFFFMVNQALPSTRKASVHKHSSSSRDPLSISPKRSRSPLKMDEDDLDQSDVQLISRSHKSDSSITSATETKVLQENDKNGLGQLTVDDAIEAVGFGTFQVLVLVYAGMTWMADAMEMMLLSFVGPAVQKHWGLSAAEESMITSVVFFGMMFGAYFWGIVSDLKGRRSGFFFTATLTFGAGILSAFSPNYYTLLLFRGLVGIGLAGGSVITSWFLEFIPTPNRGRWMVIVSVFWTLGSVAEALLAWAVMPTLGWRWLLGLSSIPLLVLLVFYPFVPESPRYLVGKGKTDEALEVLQKLALINKRPLPSGQLSQEKTNHEVQTRWIGHEAYDLFWALFSPSMIRSTLLLWLVFFANAFTYYGLVLLTSELSGGAANCNMVVDASANGANAGDLYKDVLVTSFAELPGLVLSAVIVDRFGRKNSMAGLFLACSVFLLPLVQPLDGDVTTFLLFGARACIMGAFTIVYIYAPEVYPTQLRATGLGTANSFARIGGVLCPLVAVELIKSCQLSLAIGLFVAVPVLGSLAVIFLPVETKGRLLTDTVEDSNL